MGLIQQMIDRFGIIGVIGFAIVIFILIKAFTGGGNNGNGQNGTSGNTGSRPSGPPPGGPPPGGPPPM